ncbi:NAD(P)-binding protein [Mycena albidolilacea]|uniref:NAD(P)-binding protein n=1 Tax=Mycena albidolilacea TaxID=1033008 RepID=A0AAD7EDS8_9AGAR|nr:NAD(P)-binding protein [Mycena albidolilacea]
MGNTIPFSLRHMTPSTTYTMVQQSFFCGKPKWTTDDVPDLSGQVMIVTGGNAGVGRQTVKALLEHHAKVYMASRNQKKAEAAIEELYESTGKRAVFLHLDLSDLLSVKRAAMEFLRVNLYLLFSKEQELHVLYNNGGIMVPPIQEATRTGYDLTFATNVLGHFYLTKLLLPILISTAQKLGTVRVVTITSMVHYVGTIKYDTFKDEPARRKRTPFDLYAQSKWANAVFAVELARRYGEQDIVATSVNPGNIRTDVARNSTGLLTLFVKSILIHPVEWGAVTQLWAGVSAEGAQLNGKYVAPWGRVAKHRRDVEDPERGRELWDWLEEQVSSIPELN